MTDQHTPGPWRACYLDEFGGGNIRSDHHRDGTGALLLEAGPMFHGYTPDKAEEVANLTLGAAAPELLAALRALLRSLTWPGPIPWAQAEAAIAKATEGE